MHELGVEEWLVSAVMSLYHSASTAVKIVLWQLKVCSCSDSVDVGTVTGRFAPLTFRLLDVSPPGRFAPDCGRFAPVCLSTCLLFFRTPERDGRVDRQNCYQYLA